MQQMFGGNYLSRGQGRIIFFEFIALNFREIHPCKSNLNDLVIRVTFAKIKRFKHSETVLSIF